MYNKYGLTDEQVIEKRKKYGSNTISNSKTNTFFHMFLETLGDPIIKILLIVLAIKIIFLIKDFDWYETIGIIIAIFLASFISAISEYGSQKAFDRLTEESSKSKCRVRRNNKVEEIYVDDIVKDDIVILNTGDKIPADGVIVEGKITVDESMMNGETKEVYKESCLSLEKITKNNLVYRATTIYEGSALMLVTKVGNDSFYGNLAQQLQEKTLPSPLKIRLANLAKLISKIGYICAFLVFVSYLFSKTFIENNISSVITNFPLLLSYILQALTLSVTIIVVAVPEGLPMMITLVLSSNMKRMVKNNVLVRKLVGIETAGSLNILFTDKTGTLTNGKMEVIQISSINNSFNSMIELNNYPKYKELIINSIIYNTDSIYDPTTSTIIGGNLTDKSLMDFVKTKQNKEVQIIDKLAFDSKNKYSISIIDKNNNKIKLVKGAVEKIINECNYYYDLDGKRNLLKNKKELLNKIDNMTSKGIRAIALATSNNTNILNSVDNLTLIAIVYIKDEIRMDAKEGIELVEKAHIQTVMITGDNKNTAVSIAKEIGLVKNIDDLVLTSDEINKLTDEELKEKIPKLKVVSRALPQDKSRLVKLSQELNLVVGMTGDGVNDSLALKKADVGFAMGSGMEVAKEASDIVVLDDNFKSIASAILYGRTIFKSIRKFIIFQLTVNLCAVSISIIGPFIGIPSPVTVIQMLWINMVMDTLAGLAFSYEPPKLEYMEEKPKKKDENIINKYMINEIIITGLYSAVLCILFLKLDIIKNLFRYSPDNIYLLTAFFGLFIFISIFNSFNARTHRLNLFSQIYKNKAFMLVISFIIVVQIYLIYYGGNIFRTKGLTIEEFIIMLLIAITVIPVDFIRKIYLKKKGLNTGV